MHDGVSTPYVSGREEKKENKERKDQACELKEALVQQRERRVHVTGVSFIFLVHAVEIQCTPVSFQPLTVMR